MGDQSEEYLRQKKQLYDAFSTIYDEEDQIDAGRLASREAWKNKSSAKSSTTTLQSNKRTPLSRSTSDTTTFPGVRSGVVQDVNTTFPSTEPTSLTTRRTSMPNGLQKSISEMTKPPLHTNVSTRKRKRDDAAKAVPEHQRIFKGLNFYFFPNDDKHPARRMRIGKAVDFGAKWVRDWTADVTHVIVDRTMDRQGLLKYLKLDELPVRVKVVSEHYPAECLAYRLLLPPEQARFTVKGFETHASQPSGSTDSDTSLQLKPPRKATPPATQRGTPVLDANINIAATVATKTKVVRDTASDVSPRIEDSFRVPAHEQSAELDDAVRRARTLRHLPLDEEEENSRPSTSEGQGSGEENSRPSTSEGPGSGDEEQTGLRLLNKHKGKMARLQDRFACMQKHTGDKSDTPNQRIIDILQQMADYYGQTSDEWRSRAYRKAISTLRNAPKIQTKEEALALPNIGERLAAKIEEIAFTARLRRLENAKIEPSDQVLQTFMQVYGVGIVQASKWADQGYTTLDELLQKANVSDNQRIGIEHFEDFNSRIPRAEVKQHGDIVRSELQKIDPTFEVIIGGSYRRGCKDSGDIDCLVTRPDTGADHLRNVVLGQLIPQLRKQGFVVASLAVTSRDDGSKWHGASCLPNSKIWRRLDLLLVPHDELGAALIYWTGDDIFNRSIRLLASTRGMRLNQRGLYKDVIRGPGRFKLTQGTLVEGKDEKKIFEALDVPWRPPEHRIC